MINQLPNKENDAIKKMEEVHTYFQQQKWSYIKKKHGWKN